MRNNPILWIILAIIGIGLVWLFLLPSQTTETVVDPAAYQTELAAARRKKDDFMRTSADSPISDKASFRGLAYFPADLSFRVQAKLEPFPEDKREKLVIRMTDGSEEVYEKYGHANFTLAGKPCRLLLLTYQKSLTVLFQDATAGHESYGGGRYLDIEPNAVKDNTVTLDFNAAYNPYCAYNPTYACPLPPPENKLDVAVRAGERYVAHD
ncbi:DUF1684 domain-containing protein [Fibrella sp. HMF5335]|uniref:DUF1684 domain-containing protein n=1 Tax=Fibrella rubiginis TaxID=2817060 RepID=A0A939K331_9BACT|nr:DUF1684 domain-containing protein [Fibrella rubiginis]MBO0935213.1 DUF1684 domain-containing protein [Fibrella rubiginis]